jgi:uncharacterized protein
VKRLLRSITRLALTLHIYLSMAGFVLVLLFGITGLTLNHDDFGFSQPQVTTTTLSLERSLVVNPDKDAIAGELTRQLAIRSPVTEYRADDHEVDVTFTAPGSRVQVTIDRTDGTAHVERETRGLIGRIDDLHKGLDSGRVWSWIIDLTAVLLICSALTGIATLLSLPKRRVRGLLAGAIAFGVLVMVYLIWVPR